MLRRAKRLRRFFVPFCTELDRPDLALNDEEWRQIDYLLWITEPFFDFTNELSKTKDTTTDPARYKMVRRNAVVASHGEALDMWNSSVSSHPALARVLCPIRFVDIYTNI
jgi:hypothetical protein